MKKRRQEMKEASSSILDMLISIKDDNGDCLSDTEIVDNIATFLYDHVIAFSAPFGSLPTNGSALALIHLLEANRKVLKLIDLCSVWLVLNLQQLP